jgi:hypothetical protein
LILLVQHAVPWRFLGLEDLDLVARPGFALSGFLMAGLLLRGRDGVAGSTAGKGRPAGESWIGAIRQIVPIPYAALAIAAALYLPGVEALAWLRSLELTEFLTTLDRNVGLLLAYFGRLSFEGWFWMAWPMAALLAPRRVFLPMFLAALGLGPIYHFWSLFAADVEPASILVAPSAFDLLAAGAFLGMVCHRADTGNGRHLRIIPAALALATALVGFSFSDRFEALGSVGFLKAPAGFGLGNSLLELSTTILVASLSWQYVPKGNRGIEGSPAR